MGPGASAQRSRRDDGTLASQLARRGGQQEDLRRARRHRDQAGRFRDRAVPWRRRVPAPAPGRRAGNGRHRRNGGEPCRLHRPRRPGSGRQVEGRRRAGRAERHRQSRSGLGDDRGRLARRDPGGQDSDDSYPPSPRALLRAGGGDSRDPGLVREAFRRHARNARTISGGRPAGR